MLASGNAIVVLRFAQVYAKLKAQDSSVPTTSRQSRIDPTIHRGLHDASSPIGERFAFVTRQANDCSLTYLSPLLRPHLCLPASLAYRDADIDRSGH